MRSALAPIRHLRAAGLPALAAPPVRYSAGGVRLPLFTRTDTTTQLGTYGSEPTLFACVNRLANAVAQVEWHLYRKAPNGQDEDRVEVTSHAALDLLRNPAKGFYTRQQFMEVADQHLELAGESYWVIGEAGGLPISMWPIRPDRMAPVPHPTKFLAGYVYSDPDGARIPFEPHQVIHLKYPDPLDPYHGLGPVRSLLVDLDASRYASEWNRNFFMNSAQPGGLIRTELNLTDDEFDELQARWSEQHQGVANAHRVAILEGNMQWVDRSFSMRDMEFTALQGVSDARIMLAFGMSKTLLGQTEAVNRATAEAAEYVFAKYQVVPRLRRIQEVLNTQLLPRYGPRAADLEFDFDDPISGNTEVEVADRDSRVNAAVALIAAGFDPDDVTDFLDLPRMRFEVKEAPAPPALPAGTATEDNPEAELAAIAARLMLTRSTHAHHHPGVVRLRPRAAGDPPDLDPADLPDITRLQEDYDEILDALIDDWTGIEDEQKDELVAAILAIADDGSITDLADLNVTLDPAIAALLAAMLAIGERAAEAVVEEAEEQGVKVKPQPVDEGRAKDVATVVASLLAGRLASGAAAAAMRANGPGVTAQEVGTAVREHLDTLSVDTPRAQLGGALTGSQNEARLETFRKAPEGALYANEVNDSNTCVSPDALITTRTGRVYAKDITLDDELLTHAGRWVRPSAIIVSQVEHELYRITAAGRTLRATPDHPVLVATDSGFVWRHAGQLAAGDLVVVETLAEVDSEPRFVDLGFGEAPHVVPPVGQVGRLPLVDVGSEGMPVVAVSLDDEAPTDEEIDDPRPDLSLSTVGQVLALQNVSDSSFDTGLGVAGPVAPNRAVPLAGLGRRHDPERDAAMVAVDDDGRPAARLRAVGPDGGLGVAELGATPATGGRDAPGVAAFLGASDVSVGGGDWHVERSTAGGANLGDSFVGWGGLGAEIRVGELALLRAVDSAGLPPVGDLAATGLAGRRRVVWSTVAPALECAAGSASHGPAAAQYLATVETRSVHDFSVLVIPVEGVEVEPYEGEVFDFTVPHDHTFFAAGVLVHNCGPCKAINGKWLGNISDLDEVLKLYPGGAYGGYVGCEGRERCRGTVTGIWRR